MKVLWIVNTVFPAPSVFLGIDKPVLGGWMYSLAKKVSEHEHVELAVATHYDGNDFKEFREDNIIYYLIPSKYPISYVKSLEPYWRNICHNFKPNLIHIHGTEFTHGLACVRACPEFNYLLSIQGLKSEIEKYYYAGINFWTILKNITFRDVVKRTSIFNGKSSFKHTGKFEEECISKVKHVIGRTDWDYAHAKALNPSLNYHFCNESLREDFYSTPKWDIKNKVDHTIFVSQAPYPLKGLHQVLRAMPYLISEFPNIKIRISGNNIIKVDTLKDRIKLIGYGAYIKSLIKKYKLTNNVNFLGRLPQDKMILEYKNAHLCICPSSIENSPNSIGESQILGVPTIGSYVGGIPSMIDHKETGLLYRFEDVVMLSENIRQIFNNEKLALKLSENSIKTAEGRHNLTANLSKTMEIYKIVAGL